MKSEAHDLLYMQTCLVYAEWKWNINVALYAVFLLDVFTFILIINVIIITITIYTSTIILFTIMTIISSITL